MTTPATPAALPLPPTPPVGRVTAGADFQAWSREVSALLAPSPTREVSLTL